jgi:hypothetical protein
MALLVVRMRSNHMAVVPVDQLLKQDQGWVIIPIKIQIAHIIVDSSRVQECLLSEVHIHLDMEHILK